jgi:hypothetical protein
VLFRSSCKSVLVMSLYVSNNLVTLPDDGCVIVETRSRDWICTVCAYDGFVNKHEMDFAKISL